MLMDGFVIHSLALSGRILLVGPDETAQALETAIGSAQWLLARSRTTAGVLARLRADPDIDAVILTPPDAVDPYIELCRHIKFDARTAFVGVILVLPRAHAVRRVDVFAAGADECIQSPAQPDEVMWRLTNVCRVKRATDSLEDSTAIIASLAGAIEGRDAYTRGHVERVSTYCCELGRRLGVSDEDIAILRIGGIVHDIGKVAVPDQILNKPGKLTPEEFDLVKRHPVVGYDILRPLRTFRRVLPLVRWHHERLDGKGYPDGLEEKEITLLPRIMGVADVFDALSTARPYRPAFPPPEYRRILTESAGKNELDSDVVRILFKILDEQDATMISLPVNAVLVKAHPSQP
jgi:putative two-component system response regulator